MFENLVWFIKNIIFLVYMFGFLEYEFLVENELKFMMYIYMGFLDWLDVIWWWNLIY